MSTVHTLRTRLLCLHGLNQIRLWLVVSALLVVYLPLSAQTESGAPSAQRTFVTKDGDKFTARIVRLSSDGKSVTLRTSDELDHQMETTSLSLDNQIFVRDWIEAQVAQQSQKSPSQVQLTVEPDVTKFERRTFAVDGRSVTHEEMHESYRLKLNQPTAGSRVALRVTYLILYWEKIAVYEVADGTRSDWSSVSGRGRMHYRYEKVRLPVDRLSALQEKITAPIKIDRLEGLTEAERLGHDQLIGIYVRTEDPFGNLVAEYTDLPEQYAKLGWTALNASRQGEDISEDSGSTTGVLNLKSADLRQ